MERPVEILSHANRLIEEMYEALIILHEKTHSKKCVELLNKIHAYELEFGVEIENILKKGG